MNNPDMLRHIILSEDERFAVASAIDFLMHCDDYLYDEKPFSFKTASATVDKVENCETTYSKSELAVCVAAIDLVLHSLQTKDDSYDQVTEIFPEIIEDLEEVLPILQNLYPRLCAYLADLN